MPGEACRYLSSSSSSSKQKKQKNSPIQNLSPNRTSPSFSCPPPPAGPSSVLTLKSLPKESPACTNAGLVRSAKSRQLPPPWGNSSGHGESTYANPMDIAERPRGGRGGKGGTRGGIGHSADEYDAAAPPPGRFFEAGVRSRQYVSAEPIPRLGGSAVAGAVHRHPQHLRRLPPRPGIVGGDVYMRPERRTADSDSAARGGGRRESANVVRDAGGYDALVHGPEVAVDHEDAGGGAGRAPGLAVRAAE